MKALKTLLIAIACSTTLANASDTTIQFDRYQPGIFTNFTTPNYVRTGCDQGITVTLDEGKILGKFAYLSNFVDGFCEIYVNPNSRLYKISKTEEAGCGSLKYTATRVMDGGVATLEIIDHRPRLCEDVVPAAIIATEKLPSGEVFKTFSTNVVDAEIPVTCMAFWEGYEFNQQTQNCEYKSASGCQNPFQFATLEQCEEKFDL